MLALLHPGKKPEHWRKNPTNNQLELHDKETTKVNLTLIVN